MKIVRGRTGDAVRLAGPDQVTGVLRMDPVIDEAPVRAFNVAFEPGGRNHWHRHEVAQIIVMGTGEGIIADGTGHIHRLLPGDVVHVGAGEEHWHGASPDSFVTYFVLSVGSTEMLDRPVGDAEYTAAWAQVAPDAS
ncbi:cupin domain-containing protein [Microbacterium invictum]|uniref:Quercetin dioxygenase-like cupin family protein n=1 Tax=Microbacterium invictum TaxID=515415 RepID=A0AA40SRV1_9MICO|nr:cupin domain-containing protein [Microbacterium invictum]MBB4141295.1 quercetin dioxygenase-like cupin family protein [Microbacterium invictum]